MQRLLELCDAVEHIENERKRLEGMNPEVEMKPESNKSSTGEKEPAADLKTTLVDPMASIQIDPEDVYEVDNGKDKYQVVTYHRKLI